MKVAVITNIPAPYREAVHAIAAEHFQQQYHVIYCDNREPDRQWKIEHGSYPQSILKPFNLHYKDRFIHINPDVVSKLKKLNPDVVITMGGFNPTMLLAFGWCILKRKTHIPMTDGGLRFERKLSAIHKLIRHIVYRHSKAFIGASQQSMALYQNYGCASEATFQSHLCANNALYRRYPLNEKKYDLMFSGQFIERKQPLFFAQVAKRIKDHRGRCSVLILGDGPLKEIFLKQLSNDGIDFHYPGFVDQQTLPQYFGESRVFLFPTLEDAWGVVSNEACAAGVPVITCEESGAANDLIRHGENGYILALDADDWAAHTLNLLEDDELHNRMSENALKAVQPFNYTNAAQGIIDAVEFTVQH